MIFEQICGSIPTPFPEWINVENFTLLQASKHHFTWFNEIMNHKLFLYHFRLRWILKPKYFYKYYQFVQIKEDNTSERYNSFQIVVKSMIDNDKSYWKINIDEF